MLADHTTFSHSGKIGAIEAAFNSETGTIAFRADFPNPEGVLRHGQSGTVSIDRELKDAILIPQRATFEIRDRRYVYVVDKDSTANMRAVTLGVSQGDQQAITQGLQPGEKIVVSGNFLISSESRLQEAIGTYAPATGTPSSRDSGAPLSQRSSEACA